MHYLFSPHHAGDHQVAEFKWHPVSLLVAFIDIQLAIVEIENPPVFDKTLNVFCRGKLDFM